MNVNVSLDTSVAIRILNGEVIDDSDFDYIENLKLERWRSP